MNTMPEPRPCPQCGSPIPAGAAEGLCPRCLLALNLATQSRMAGDTQPPGAVPAVPPLALEEVAKLFPQLEIIRPVGTGGMGAVYQARQPALDRFVALKLLHTPPANDPGFAERFAQEARALAKLNHPNIVALYESGQAGGRLYFLMEFVDGVNLRQLQQAGRLSPREALQIVPQVCDALQYAHDEGIVHRDIKPENVLIDRKGRVKVADFGLAKLMGRETASARLTAAGNVMGTPHYMAPEQVEHPLEVDHRADIFSLGVVFYELLTGELPLGKFPMPSKKVRIDVRLDEVVLKALEKEPALRYGQASELKTRVETITKGASGAKWAFGREAPPNMRGLAYVALGCLVAGLVGTPTMMAFSADTAALCFGAVLGLMALVFGIESRSDRLGRRVAWATAAILVAFGLTMTVWTVVRRSQVAQNMALLGRASEKQHGQMNEGTSASQFGPVVERLVGDIATHQAPELIKLGSGEVVFQKDILGSTEGLDLKKVADIFRARGIDATGTLDPNTRGLAGWECVALPMSASGWTDLSPVMLGEILEGSQAGSPVVMVGTGRLPATYAIKTRTGRMGLLQILGFSGKPRGVNIRYKLVRDGGEVQQGAGSAAQEWLSLMDKGYYAQSWDAAAESFRSVVTKVKWAAESEKIRQPLGDVISRKLVTTQQAKSFPGMPDGSYWMGEYDTAFAGLKSAAETVTFMREKDGRWRVIGYFIRPRTEEERAVVVAARAWLEGIDQGRYAESWSNASGLFRDALSQKKWVEALEEVRRPLGARVFRTADACTTTTSLPGVPAGRYVVMQFNAAFSEDKTTDVETVTFVQEKDGVWRAAGYFIK